MAGPAGQVRRAAAIFCQCNLGFGRAHGCRHTHTEGVDDAAMHDRTGCAFQAAWYAAAGRPDSLCMPHSFLCRVSTASREVQSAQGSSASTRDIVGELVSSGVACGSLELGYSPWMGNPGSPLLDAEMFQPLAGGLVQLRLNGERLLKGGLLPQLPQALPNLQLLTLKLYTLVVETMIDQCLLLQGHMHIVIEVGNISFTICVSAPWFEGLLNVCAAATRESPVLAVKLIFDGAEWSLKWHAN